MRDSFQKTAPRKTAENTVKCRDGGVGSVVANQQGGGESLVVVTTLFETRYSFFAKDCAIDRTIISAPQYGTCDIYVSTASVDFLYRMSRVMQADV